MMRNSGSVLKVYTPGCYHHRSGRVIAPNRSTNRHYPPPRKLFPNYSIKAEIQSEINIFIFNLLYKILHSNLLKYHIPFVLDETPKFKKRFNHPFDPTEGIVKLSSVLFLSKFKKLQRIPKISLNLPR